MKILQIAGIVGGIVGGIIGGLVTTLPTCPGPGGSMLDACEMVPGLVCPTSRECALGWKSSSPNSKIGSIPYRWVQQSDRSVQLEVCTVTSPGGGIWRGTLCPIGFPRELTLLEWCRRANSLPVPAGMSNPKPVLEACGKEP